MKLEKLLLKIYCLSVKNGTPLIKPIIFFGATPNTAAIIQSLFRYLSLFKHIVVQNM